LTRWKNPDGGAGREGDPDVRHENPSYVSRAAALGAADFLWKDAPTEAFVDAIHRAARGEEPPADSLIRQVRAELQSRPAPSLDGVALTKREYVVLRHLAQGLSNREIGMSLNISIGTVKEHTENILRKLDVPDRTAAAVHDHRRQVVSVSIHRHTSLQNIERNAFLVQVAVVDA
jgi:DNA-binding NarL/FixJ family response regulator